MDALKSNLNSCLDQYLSKLFLELLTVQQLLLHLINFHTDTMLLAKKFFPMWIGTNHFKNIFISTSVMRQI